MTVYDFVMIIILYITSRILYNHPEFFIQQQPPVELAGNNTIEIDEVD